MKNKIRYFSTFTGIGGFELGINKAYESNNEHARECEKSESEECPQGRKRSTDQPGILLHDRDRTTPLCVGYSEINKYAIQIYEKHYPQHHNFGDITKINATQLPDFDLFVGGFPCQAFSIAGKRGGFDDTRGTLFFDCARILKEKQPRNFILENVKGLLSHDNGRTFKTIINTLTELGYCVEWQVLNAKNFGVPQNRERVFIVGHLGGIPERKVFPITGSSQGNLKYSGAVISARQKWLQDGKNFSRNFSQGQRIYDTNGISQCLAGNAGGQGGKTGLYETTEMKIRRLTPLECERLMGYPEDKKYAILELCYEQAKNYVNVVRQNPKLQKLVLSVENKEWKKLAEYVENHLQLKNQPIENSAQENVSSKNETSHNPLNLSADNVEKRNKNQSQELEEDSVLLNVLINITEGRITPNGREELQVNELKQMAQVDGQSVVSLSGNEIMQLANDAVSDLLTEKIKPLMFTISSDSEIKKLDTMLIILYFYATNVINGFTQEKIPNKNISLGFRTINGWTEGLSDTQRYKTLGNGIVSNVVAEVVKRLYY